MEGWIKSYRAILDNPIVCKDTEHFAVWGYLIHNAAHAPSSSYFNGRRITLKAGQLITGRKKIAAHFKINDSKVYRILKTFENEHQIKQQTSNASSLISITNWGVYQSGEQRIEQPLNNNRTTIEQRLNIDRTTVEQQLNTIQECNNVIIEECNNSTHTDFSNLKISSRVGAGDAHDACKAREALDWVAENYPAVQAMPEPLTEQQAAWLVAKYTTEDIQRIVMAMDNKGATKNKSAFATFSGYARHDLILKERKEATVGKAYTYAEVCDMVSAGKAHGDDFKPQLVGGKKLFARITDPTTQTNA